MFFEMPTRSQNTCLWWQYRRSIV